MNTLSFLSNTVLILILFFGMSCSSGDPDDPTNLILDYIPPLAIAAPSISSLQAKAVIDDEEYNLSVNDDNSIYDTIRNVPSGTQTVKVIYYLVLDSQEITLLHSSKEVKIIKSETTTITSSGALFNRNYDFDGDGYTNLAEVRIGTDLLDYADKPSGDNPAFSIANSDTARSDSTNYRISAQVGDKFSGKSTSTNFIIQSEISAE